MDITLAPEEVAGAWAGVGPARNGAKAQRLLRPAPMAKRKVRVYRKATNCEPGGSALQIAALQQGVPRQIRQEGADAPVW
ncbi:hypothetical protein A0H81_14135 [Grifola frondosa]|uniref:Uncharacterized protein n=1 Tax=Grifola frondosa TaxID=5627 RepID=A0A1C7LM85_GRIFR|nr:hypothetical protein A0H81_14135 [Grifola frondosa]